MLDRTNPFIVHLDNHWRWYRNHYLFAGLLIKRINVLRLLFGMRLKKSLKNCLPHARKRLLRDRQKAELLWLRPGSPG